jgi:hypothetical protein
VAAFLFAATAIAAVVGFSLIWPNALLDRLWELNKPGAAAFRALGGRISGTALLLLGAGTLAAGIGLLERKRWAWWFAVVLVHDRWRGGRGEPGGDWRLAEKRLRHGDLLRLNLRAEPQSREELFPTGLIEKGAPGLRLIPPRPGANCRDAAMAFPVEPEAPGTSRRHRPAPAFRLR